LHSKILPDHCISGRTLEQVDGVVLHYFSAKNVDPARQFDLAVCRNLFLDLNKPKSTRRWFMHEEKWPEDRMYASAHLLIGRQGVIWKLVEYDKQAFHAGASIMNGRSHCNRWTLGIELIGTQDSGFSKAQYEALANLLLILRAEFGFDSHHIQGHDTVRWAAIQAGSEKRPKYDPSGRKDGGGDNFDWFYLYKLMGDLLTIDGKCA
jgi:N-acetyl-anhydromuramyl-L-alanine amidase AmpD